jgi:hypothetical protein
VLDVFLQDVDDLPVDEIEDVDDDQDPQGIGPVLPGLVHGRDLAWR